MKPEIVLVNSAQAIVLLLGQWNALDRIEPMQKKLNEENPTESRPACVTSVFGLKHVIEEKDLAVTIVVGLCLYSYKPREHHTEMVFAICTPLELVERTKKEIRALMKKMPRRYHRP